MLRVGGASLQAALLLAYKACAIVEPGRPSFEWRSGLSLFEAVDPYSMVWPVGFLRFGNGTLAIYGFGSCRIVKFQWNLKVLGVLAGRNRECPQGGRTARPGSNIVENVRVGGLGALPQTLGTYAHPPALVVGP